MAKIVGFSGRAGSGKSTCAQYLVSKGYRLDAYARRMKKAVSLLFGIPMETLLGDITKKTELQPYWEMTSRDILQKFGTETMRDTFGPGFWEKSLWQTYDGPRERDASLVIEDVRFPNEAEAILMRGGIVIEVVNQATEPAPRQWWEILFGLRKPHRSEIPLPSHLVSVVIKNDGSIEQLHMAVDRALERFQNEG